MSQEAPATDGSINFSRGYSKRVRDAFSDASSDSGNETIRLPKTTRISTAPLRAKTTLSSKSNDHNGKRTVSRSDSAQENLRLKPWEWTEKYGGTEFVCDSCTGNAWFSDGPFKGWIYDGPGKGSYIPGYRTPDDETLIKAEKIAMARIASDPVEESSETSSLSDDENSEQGDLPDDGPRSVAEQGPGKLYFGNPQIQSLQLTPLQDNPECPHSGSMDEESYHTAPLPEISPSISSKQALLPTTEAKATERAGRIERTKQYVLAGSPTNHGSRDTNSPRISSSKNPSRLPDNLAPTSTPRHRASSPPSGVSETTSTLITRQLTESCPPPSNQELAVLLSSSPTNQDTKTLSSVERANDQNGSENYSADASSTEPSSGIPACLPRAPPPPPVSPDRESPIMLEHPSARLVMNGIAHQRSTRPLVDPWSISSAKRRQRMLTTNRETPLAQKETPTKPERSRLATKETNSQPKENTIEPLAKTKIIVELPTLPSEKQAEYSTISPLQEAHNSPLSPKTFKEIEGATSKVSTQSNDSSEEALGYVLRESPHWLGSITQIEEPRPSSKADKAVINVPESTLSSSTKAPVRRASMVEENVTLSRHSNSSDEPAPSGKERRSKSVAAFEPTSTMGPDSRAVTPIVIPPSSLKRKEHPMDGDSLLESSELSSSSENCSEYTPAQKKRKLETSNPIKNRVGGKNDATISCPDAAKPRLRSTTPIPRPVIPLLSQGPRKIDTTAARSGKNVPMYPTAPQQLHSLQSTTPVPRPTIPFFSQGIKEEDAMTGYGTTYPATQPRNPSLHSTTPIPVPIIPAYALATDTKSTQKSKKRKRSESRAGNKATGPSKETEVSKTDSASPDEQRSKTRKKDRDSKNRKKKKRKHKSKKHHKAEKRDTTASSGSEPSPQQHAHKSGHEQQPEQSEVTTLTSQPTANDKRTKKSGKKRRHRHRDLAQDASNQPSGGSPARGPLPVARTRRLNGRSMITPPTSSRATSLESK
ncbi:hypothetical protein F5B20DRAFT_566409 [Whalleya microplaca]|nr:hypothetical protein F5B20DRAFT_566409 [Whalleya microplaca]